jgi:hypothetical protein
MQRDTTRGGCGHARPEQVRQSDGHLGWGARAAMAHFSRSSVEIPILVCHVPGGVTAAGEVGLDPLPQAGIARQ